MYRPSHDREMQEKTGIPMNRTYREQGGCTDGEDRGVWLVRLVGKVLLVTYFAPRRRDS